MSRTSLFRAAERTAIMASPLDAAGPRSAAGQRSLVTATASLCDREAMTGLPDPDQPAVPADPIDGFREPADDAAPAEQDKLGPEVPAPETGEDVYKLDIPVAPAGADTYQLQFANSSYKPEAKAWGEVVGSLADTAVEPEPESTG
jgi:hypothetical protein